MPDIRTALTEALEGYQPETEVQKTEVEPVETAEAKADRLRDDQGRFAPKQEAKQEPAPEQKPGAEPQAPIVPAPQPQVRRPHTWKKEYWPLWDRLSTGQALTPDEAKKLADYSLQREGEFASGVSTYKAEAEQAKAIQTALAPFMPDLQRFQIDPGQWISNLGNAHRTLALGSPQERIQMFKRMAQEYQIPLSALTEGAEPLNANPQVDWLTQKLTTLEQQQQQWLTSQQQREQEQIQQQISAVRDEVGPNGQPLRPHFDEVKAQMSGLLQAGVAKDLKDAYDKAIRMDDSIWAQHQGRLAQEAAAQRTAQAHAVVQKAKAAAVSPRSASPSAQDDGKPKGRRAMLEDQFDSLSGGRV